MGKTSALNLALKALANREIDKPEQQKTIIVTFNPWHLGGRDDVYRAFFTKLGDQFEESGLVQAANLARDYGQRLIKAAPEIVAAVTAFSTGNWWSSVKSGWGSLRALGTKSAKPTKSLETLRKELSLTLNKGKRRVIVVMDDLDRLLPDEMRDMFTLVKSLGDLPYVIYLLAFDRRIVASGLETAGVRKPDDSPEFLEKLVQTYLDLPTPSRDGLDRMFFTSLDEVFGENVIFAKERWSSLYSRGLRRLLTSPRTVVRVSNGIATSWPPVAGQVDMPDFVGLELIRALEPDLYSAIRRHLGWLVGYEPFLDDKIGEQVAKELHSRIRHAEKDAISFIISSMFPRLDKVGTWPKSYILRPNYLSMRADRRLATEEFYSHYFRFSHREDYPTTEFAAEVAAHLNDEAVCQQALDQVRKQVTPVGTTLTGRFLTDLADRIEAKSLSTGRLLNVLLKEGDELVKLDDGEEAALFSVSNDTRIRRLIPLCVRSIPKENRSDILVEHIQTAHAPWTAMTLWWKLAEEHGKVGEEPVQPEEYRLVDSQTLDRLSATVVERLSSMAMSESFLDSPHLAWILHSWATAGANQPDLEKWVGGHLNDVRLVASLADGMMGKTRPVGEKRWRHTLRRDARQELVAIPALSEAARTTLAHNKEITSEQKETLGIFVTLSEKVLGGAEVAKEAWAED